MTAPFIVIEGTDGSGTTTQTQLLTEWFVGQGCVTPWQTCQPSHSPIGLLIRQVLSGVTRSTGWHDAVSDPRALSLLFAADRTSHVLGILQTLQKDIPVVCDRYYHSSLVYQGMDLGFDPVWELNREFPVPDLTLFLRISAETGARRRASRLGQDMFEDLETQRRVVAQYDYVMTTLECRRHRIVTIDSDDLTVPEVRDIIVGHVETLMERFR